MDFVATYAAAHPNRLALVEGERGLTWEEFFRTRNRLAHGLAELGVRPGEHAVVYAHNSLENLLAVGALRALGAVAVPMNHRLTTDEVAYVLDNADAAAVFVGDAFVPMAERVRDAARVKHWITVGTERRPWATALADLLAGDRETALAASPAGAGGSMIYTAGTTGKPKGALRRTIDAASVIPRISALGCADPDQVHLVAGPLYHSAPSGFALYAQMVGGTVVIMPRFDAEDAMRHIERHRCTTTFMAPTLVKRIVDLPAQVRARYDVSSMRALVIAAAPCPMRVKEQALAMFGPALYEFYGSTELGINTVLRPEDMLRKPGACGRAAPGVELAILDDDGRPVPTGTAGELFVQRYSGVFDEYYRNPAATAQTARGEWLSVGDVAWMDDEGFVYICDRKRDMIISGGVNIYPAEIEDALHRHPAIDDVAVFGVPDAEWGERVHAAIRLRGGHRVSERDLIDFCRDHLAGYKIPREISFHDEFPRDTAGKLLKRLLREPYWRDRSTRV
jgi:acyl-CoA synthetase (AMP-forming)/AMP-acid ligase II